MNSRKGQNITEYALLLIIFIIVLVYFLGSHGPFQRIINGVLDGSVAQYENAVDRIKVNR